MTDKQNPTVAALRNSLSDAWKDLPKDKQDTIKKVVSEIEAMAATVAQRETALEGTPLPEAHSSANVCMVDPATKANVQFTFRGHTDTDVERRVVDFLTRITGQQTAQHWLTQDAYRDQNWGNKGGDKQPHPKQQGQPVAAPAQTGNGQVMTCQALKLSAMQKSANDSALMWKVWTNKSKYAVPIYMDDDELVGVRERLTTAGINIQSFVDGSGNLAEYDLTGWTANYLPTEKDGEIKPWPSKIVDLTK